MKKFVVAALCALLVSAIPESTVKTYAAEFEPIYIAQLPNPFIMCETVEDAEETAGFDLTPPTDLPEGFNVQVIQAIKDDLIDIHYVNKDNTIIVRKSSSIEDCSGNYFDYTEMVKVLVNNQNIILKCKKGKAYVAVWNDGTHSYSITINDESAGLDISEMTKLIHEMK